MVNKNDKSKLTNNNSTKILGTGRFEKQYLNSALTTRFFSIGLSETKSLKTAVKRLRQFDHKYKGLHNPFHFDKVLKHQSKYFWNPFIPLFYTEPFERYLLNEVDQLDPEGLNTNATPGVVYIDFNSCGSKSRLNTTIDLFLKNKFKIDSKVYKLYIRWNYGPSLDYMLSRFLSSIDKQCETWLVIDSDNTELNLDFLAEKGLKGVIINLSTEDLSMLYEDNTGYDMTPLSLLSSKVRNAGLLVGANTILEEPDPTQLLNYMKNLKDHMVNFVVWNELNGWKTKLETDSEKLNRAFIERSFLKSNSAKEYAGFPLVFLPDFTYRITQKNAPPAMKFSSLTFENGMMLDKRIAYNEMFRAAITSRVAPEKSTFIVSNQQPEVKRVKQIVGGK